MYFPIFSLSLYFPTRDAYVFLTALLCDPINYVLPIKSFPASYGVTRLLVSKLDLNGMAPLYISILALVRLLLLLLQ